MTRRGIVGIASLALAGCGYIGEPLYPALNIPNRVIDLSVVERGDHLDVNFTIPELTTEGLVVKSIAAIDLRVGTAPAKDFTVDQWASQAKQIDVIVPAKPQAVHTTIPLRDFVGKEVIVAVRLANPKGRVSEWSNRATLTVAPPVETPTDFVATNTAEGVLLQWKGSATQFRIFRSSQKEPQPTLLNTTAERQYLDASTVYGTQYEYFVVGAITDVESEAAGPLSITPKDTFPPAVPAGLAATAGLNSIELAWERNTEPDFKAYRIFRAIGDGSFALIAEGIESPNYSDRKIETGKKYKYAVSAIDQLGNESQRSASIELIAP